MAEQHTLYKLIILYILRKIDFSMTQTQLSDFLLGKNYTNYFSFQETLSELEESELIHPETMQNITYYTITPEGEETIRYFENRLSAEVKADIDAYIAEHGISMRDESSVQADYMRTTQGDYEVRCVVKEQDTRLIDLKLTVPSQSQAKAISLQWKKKCQDVYAYLMQELMQEP